MKKKYAIFTTLVVALAAAFTVFTSNRMTADLQPINYTIYNGDEINQEVEKGIEQYKAMLPKLELEDKDFFVTFNECKDQRIIIVGYCKGCAFADLIKSSNRFLVVGRNLKLPVLFESDRLHSNFFADPDGTRIYVSQEGYMIVADKDNAIVSKGFTQY